MKISQARSLMHPRSAKPLSDLRAALNQTANSEEQDPSSLYRELEMDSPWVDTYDACTNSDDLVQLHSHTFYEIMFCMGGNLQYLLGTRRYRLQAGDVVCIPPDTSHRPLLLDKLVEPYTHFIVWCSPAFAEAMRRAFPDQTLVPNEAFVLRTAASPWQEELGTLFRTGVQESLTRSPGWQAAVLGNTIRLMVQLARARAGDNTLAPKAEQRGLLDNLLLYIENHLAERITLPDTARLFLISESTLSQLFRNRMKVSFYRYVTQRRLIAAKVQMQEGSSAEQAAAGLGFGDYSTFYRAFKREYGITPTEYRRLQGIDPAQPTF